MSFKAWTRATALGAAVVWLFSMGCASHSPSPRVDEKTYLPGKLVRSQYAAGEITTLCASSMQKVRNRVNAIVALPRAKQNMATTLLALENTLADWGDEIGSAIFMSSVALDAGVRKEAADCDQKTSELSVQVFTRRDLYNILKRQVVKPGPESRLWKLTLEKFESSGLKLNDEKLAQMRKLSVQLSEKENQFAQNRVNDQTTIILTDDELKGVPEDMLNRWAKTPAGRVVTTKETDYMAVMTHADNEQTRFKFLLAFFNLQAEPNTKLLEEAVALRTQIAHLLGYHNWVDHRVSTGRMAKNGKMVTDFLDGLKGKLAQRNQEDMAHMLTYKREVDPTATIIQPWDVFYYREKIKQRELNLDEEKVREYFPADVVMNGLFEIYSKLLGVQFVEVKDAPGWAPGVKLYEIHEAKDSRLIGYFYTDLIPRNGKRGHPAAYPIISGRLLPTGYNLPVSAIVGDFSPPAADKPSLLAHEEVTTLFHEFGHIMHQTLTRAPYSSLSGSSVDSDFVEAPSQMLENWTWSPEMLALMSGHYRDRSQKLPAELARQLIASRDSLQGLYYTRQLLLASFDVLLHSNGGSTNLSEVVPIDSTRLYNELYLQITGMQPVPGNHYPATFGHLMGGYDVGYYGYLWSLVYAQDMFTRFPAKDLTNPEVGSLYRRTILERGNMREPMDLIKEFLGREPNSKAFFEMLHIQ